LGDALQRGLYNPQRAGKGIISAIQTSTSSQSIGTDGWRPHFLKSLNLNSQRRAVSPH
jgi:hypothetical protein